MMTREEAKATINEILGYFGNKAADGEYELTQLDAEDMREAIERLSVVECEDAISRADAISLFKDDVAAVNELMQLESVHPKVCECEDTISRQAVMDAMYDLCGEESLKDNPWRDNPHIDSITDAIEHLPSVTPKQKIGHWIEGFGGCGCSECGCLEAGYSNYCPTCGAKMEGGAND